MKRRQTILQKKYRMWGKQYLLPVLTMWLICRFIYQLQIRYCLIVCLLFMLTIRKTNRLLLKKHRFDLQFDECGDYLQQISFAFEKNGEIVASLKECEEVFYDGEMKTCISQAIEFMEHVYNGTRRDMGLHLIEEKYSCPQIRLVHNYMLELEISGGERKTGMKALREEFERFRTRGMLFQKECETRRRNSVIAIIASMLLCASVGYLVPEPKILVDCKAYQVGTMLLFLVNMGVLLLVMKKTIRNWIRPNKEYSERELERKVLKYYNQKGWIGRRTLKRIIANEITRAYPEWMLQLTIQLQHRDVAGAIMESEKNSDIVLKLYLKELIEKIHDYPDSPKPYLEFLNEFKTPESMSFMKMLYAISVGSCTNVVEQVTELFRRTQILRDDIAKKQQEKVAATMYGLFLLPTFIASIKLIADMSVILIAFTSQLTM